MPTPPTSAQQAKAKVDAAKAKVDALGGHIFRRVDGKIYNLFQTGVFVGGYVQGVRDDALIVRTGQDSGDYRAIKNYKGEAVADKYIYTVAMRNGIYTDGNTPLELYDCGTILSPDEERQQEQATREKMVADAKAKADAVTALREAQRQKSFIINSNEVVRLSLEATNGSAAAQYSLALHYLDGRGCETNKDLAVHWLKIASDGGYFGASNKLAELNH